MELEDLAAALGVPVEAITGAETIAPGSLRVRIEQAGASREVLVRGAAGEAAGNHAAVLEALSRAGFGAAPRLTAFAGGLMAETYEEGLSALAVVPSATALEAAVDAIATLHTLGLREGLRWEIPSSELVPGAGIPLHRLGFASHEREPAQELLAAAAGVLAAGPFGFVHGELHAGNVRFTANGPCLAEFGAAGHGHQLFDIAAFLSTAGLEPPFRRELAERYARRRSLPPTIADAVDLATIPWGLSWLIELPRRQVLALGDDAATEQISMLAARTHDALRGPAGDDPLAAALRAALWP